MLGEMLGREPYESTIPRRALVFAVCNRLSPDNSGVLRERTILRKQDRDPTDRRKPRLAEGKARSSDLSGEPLARQSFSRLAQCRHRQFRPELVRADCPFNTNFARGCLRP